MNIIVYAVAVLVLYGLFLVTVRKGEKRVSCQRHFSCYAAFPGQEGQLIEVVRNDSPFIIPWLRLECRVEPCLKLGRQDNLYGDEYYGSLFTLMPYQQIRRTHPVQFLHRGKADLGRINITVGDPLGIRQLRRKQEASAPVLVYPALLAPDQIPLPMSRYLGELCRRQQLQTDPFLVRGIRAYQIGDPVRDIHWPATARMGQVQVRVRDYTSRTKLMVVLNTQKDQQQWQDQVRPEEEEIVEYGICLAATLCTQALRSGLSAGFAANMPQFWEGPSTIVLPQDGFLQEVELLSAMARLEIRRTQDFCFLLKEFNRQTDLDMVVLSMYDSPDIQAALEQLRQAGNQVTFFRLRGVGK